MPFTTEAFNFSVIVFSIYKPMFLGNPQAPPTLKVVF